MAKKPRSSFTVNKKGFNTFLNNAESQVKSLAQRSAQEKARSINAELGFTNSTNKLYISLLDQSLAEEIKSPKLRPVVDHLRSVFYRETR